MDIEYFENSIIFFHNKNKLLELYKDNVIKKELINKKYTLSCNKKIISIIFLHRNRPDLLFLTLLKLNNSKYNNFEVVIVDDRSDDELKPLFIENINFNYPIKLINIENNNAGIKCTSDVYNIAFNNSIGDIILIQNPECLHLGDIPYYIYNNFEYDDYLCFPCYSSNNKNVNEIIISNNNINIENIEEETKEINIDEKFGKGYPIWFQNSEKNNRCLHFCTVISRNYYKILNGFDTIYSDGFCFEDDDLIYRIRNILKLNVVSINTNENIGVVHMFHGRNPFVNIITYKGNDVKMHAIKEKYFLNENIFNYKKDNDNKISCPKIFHYYWDNFEKFTFMNLYSLRTAVHYHKDYIHIIWSPINANNNITWSEFCHKDFEQDEYYLEYLEEIKNMKNVILFNIDMAKFLNVNNDMAEIHKSDIFRYKILNTFGGIWSDLDIVYIKKITSVINFDFENIFFKCNYENNLIIYPVGLLLSKRKTLFYEKLLKDIVNIYYDKSRYQCLGAEMYTKIFDNKIYNDVIFLNQEVYMNYIWTEIDDLFIKYENNIKNLNNTIGFHWFNGSNISKKYLKNIKNDIIPDDYNGIVFMEKNLFLKNKKNI